MRYSPGQRAWGICGRSGARALLKDLIFDGRFPNMRVLPDWFESKHPQETLPKIDDPIALYRPAPESLQPPTAPVLSGGQVATNVELAWTASTSQIALISEYVLYRATNDGEYSELDTILVVRDEFGAIASTNVYTDEDVAPGSSYRYYVIGRAVKGGASDASNELTIEME